MAVETKYKNDTTGQGMNEFGIYLQLTDITDGGSVSEDIPYLGDSCSLAVDTDGSLDGTVAISVTRVVGTDDDNVSQEIYSGSITSVTQEIDTSISGLALGGNKITLSRTGGTTGKIYLSLISKKKRSDGLGLTDIVNDLTPQLGGDLDAFGHDIILKDDDKLTLGTYSGGFYLKAGSTNTSMEMYFNGIMKYKSGAYKKHEFYGDSHLDFAIHGYHTLRSVGAGITAYSGGNQPNATVLTKDINEVATVAVNGDSVKLEAAEVGMEIKVINNQASHNLDLFPAVGGYINALAINTAISMNGNATALCTCVATGKWIVNVI